MLSQFKKMSYINILNTFHYFYNRHFNNSYVEYFVLYFEASCILIYDTSQTHDDLLLCLSSLGTDGKLHRR